MSEPQDDTVLERLGAMLAADTERRDRIARAIAPADWRVYDAPGYAHLPALAREGLVRRSREAADRVLEVLAAEEPHWEVRWGVAHSQGFISDEYGREFDEKKARARAADLAAGDERRVREHRGMVRLRRRRVTPWEDVPDA